MDSDLAKLRITKPRRELLSKMNIDSIENLITYYPYRYDIYEKKMPSIDDTKLVSEAIVLSRPKLAYKRGNQSKMVFDIIIDHKVYRASIFNRHFLQYQLSVGKEITIIGKCEVNSNAITVSDIKLQPLSSLESIVPVYSTKEGITSKSLHQYILKALDYLDNQIEAFVPNDYLEKYRLVSRKDALLFIHNPKDKHQIKHALRHLKYEEFLRFQLMMQYIRSSMKQDVGIKKEIDDTKINDFISSLSFSLTEDQSNVVQEILNDLKRTTAMHRLLQGDVGCGKTIVACIGLYANFLAGYQGALMAPTEILAKQHFHSIKDLFGGLTIKIELLIGSLTNKEKMDVYERLSNNEIDIIVGTHALLQEKVSFYDLGMVIADEQHRFGVKQREALKKKGHKVDFLLMSATPIPRTLAISLFGDMDVSTIKTMPKGRSSTITKFYKSNSLKPILKFFNTYIQKGGQCYVVCPLIEDSEMQQLKDATFIYQEMAKYYSNICHVGLLHGKMKDNEKEEIMEKFRNNAIQILVSTTVIEVGVDVSNANLMVIYNAERFGLSQLHQLRGRVGRGKQQGYCFLFSTIDNQDSLDRIKFLETTNDGFEISEYDLKIRGPGEVLGSKQSGIPTFMIADVYEDFSILEKAKDDALIIVKQLNKYPIIRDYLYEKSNQDINNFD